MRVTLPPSSEKHRFTHRSTARYGFQAEESVAEWHELSRVLWKRPRWLDGHQSLVELDDFDLAADAAAVRARKAGPGRVPRNCLSWPAAGLCDGLADRLHQVQGDIGRVRIVAIGQYNDADLGLDLHVRGRGRRNPEKHTLRPNGFGAFV